MKKAYQVIMIRSIHKQLLAGLGVNPEIRINPGFGGIYKPGFSVFGK